MKKLDLSINDDSDLKAFRTRLRERAFDPSCCFLCARHFDDVHLTEEHVIPKWAQKRFDLWDQQITLLNRTPLPYRKLTVPCCEECNKYRLQPIETSVSAAVGNGPDALRRLGDNVQYIWLGKIFYGILYREVSLLLDRSSGDGITIVNPETLREYETLLFFLQQAREKVELVNFTPGSIYIFTCQVPEEPKYQWDFCDNADTLFIAIRMGSVGIIGILGDGGAQMAHKDVYDKLKDHPLHPIQFSEICAHFSYRSTLSTRIPKYITIESTPHKTLQMPLGGWSLEPLFEGWDQAIYSHFLAYYTGYSYDIVYQGGKVMTWLHDETGRVPYIDYKKYPYCVGNEGQRT